MLIIDEVDGTLGKKCKILDNDQEMGATNIIQGKDFSEKNTQTHGYRTRDIYKSRFIYSLSNIENASKTKLYNEITYLVGQLDQNELDMEFMAE